MVSYLYPEDGGRDVAPGSGKDFVVELENYMAELGVGKIATIIMKTSDSNKLSHSAFFKVLKKSIFFTSLSSLLL